MFRVSPRIIVPFTCAILWGVLVLWVCLVVVVFVLSGGVVIVVLFVCLFVKELTDSKQLSTKKGFKCCP